MAAQIIAQGTPAEVMANPAFADRAISHRVAAGADAACRRQMGQGPVDPRQGRARQQSQEHLGRNSAGRVHLRHRRFGRRQVHAADRYGLPRRGAQADGHPRGARRARPDRRAGTARQDHRHRPIADRPHAALQSRHLYRRLHADPRLVRRAAGGQGAGATGRGGFPSTSRAGAAKPARATASSRSRCTSCPMSM